MQHYSLKLSFAITLSVWMAWPSLAATYYVRTDGNNANAGTANTAGGAWLDPQFALTNRNIATVVSNDIVRLQSGIYTNRVTVTNDGVIFVGDGSPEIRGGFLIQSADYFKVIGVSVTHSNNPSGFGYAAVRIETSRGVQLIDCYVHHVDDNALFLQGSHDFMIRGGEVSHGGWPEYPWVDVGEGAALIHFNIPISTNAVIEYLWMHDSNDYITGGSSGDVWLTIRNCMGDPVPPEMGGHTDWLQPNTGWNHMLMEANWHKPSGFSSDHHAHGHFEPPIQSHIVLRGDVNLSQGGIGLFDSDFLSYYHNTIHSNNPVSIGGQDSVVFVSSTSTGNEAYNNIFSYCVKPANQPIDIGGGSSCVRDYNLSFGQAAMNSGTHNVASDPLFISPATNESTVNLRLQSGSPARNAAGPITLANGSGSSATAITMDNAYMFWSGDSITVGGTAATILTIDSQTTATLTSAISWSDNDIILWRGQTDMGALPYGSVELSTATMLRSGTTYTVTPTGDARQVWFYVDGVPTTLDTTAPYQATIASGTVTAKAYALYAQGTNSAVLASDLGESGSAPYRNKGRSTRVAGVIP